MTLHLGSIVRWGERLSDWIHSRPSLRRWMDWHAEMQWRWQGHRRLGLLTDDIISDEIDIVQEALTRISDQEAFDRTFRIRRAMQLQLTNSELPEPEWIRWEDVRPKKGKEVYINCLFRIEGISSDTSMTFVVNEMKRIDCVPCSTDDPPPSNSGGGNKNAIYIFAHIYMVMNGQDWTKKSWTLPWPAYAADWCPTTSTLDPSDPFALIALASFTPSRRNDLLLLQCGWDRQSEIQPASLVVSYKMAATRVAFSSTRRTSSSGEYDLLALSGADVSLYRVFRDSGQAMRVDLAATLSSSATLKRTNIASEGVIIDQGVGGVGGTGASSSNSPAPITSIAWSPVDPNLLLTASYDTTCTIWTVDGPAPSIRTQLIAHDKEVFDVACSPIRSDMFVSVGAEGSLRLFDTRYFAHMHTHTHTYTYSISRNLDHSTILFETRDASPLVRVAWNPTDARYIACFGLDSADVNIIDTRAPAIPVAVLGGHAAGTSVSCCRWAPHSSGHLMSASTTHT